MMRWHGTDEANLPPAHTLQNLSRDTVSALIELQQARETIAQLRSAMGRAFWATEFRDVHAILLEALGPPPDEPASCTRPRSSSRQLDRVHTFRGGSPNRDAVRVGLKRKHPAAVMAARRRP